MAVTARRIRSAIHRPERRRPRLDIRRALAGGHRERPVSWRESGDGLAAGGFRRADGKKQPSPVGGTLAAHARPSVGDADGDPAFLAAGHAGLLAASDPDRRQPSGHRIRYLPAPLPAPPAGAGSDSTDASGAL